MKKLFCRRQPGVLPSLPFPVRTCTVAAAFTLAAVGALAEVPSTNAEVRQCETLRRHGDPGTAACYQKLAKSNDQAVRAEGLWGAKDYQGANELFRAVVKAKPKDPNPRVRWGLMYLE